MYLTPYDLTPTYRNVHNKFSVRYSLNLVLVDQVGCSVSLRACFQSGTCRQAMQCKGMEENGMESEHCLHSWHAQQHQMTDAHPLLALSE